MNDIFQKQENYYFLRNSRSQVSKSKFTATYGTDTISFRRSQIWQDLPQDIKNPDTLNLLKFNTKICDSVVLEIYLDKKFQWLQEGLNCESLVHELVM